MKVYAPMLAIVAAVEAQVQRLTVQDGGGNRTSPLLYGALYEEIYHSGDGGHYGEMIRNRAFQGSINNVRWPFNTYTPTTDHWEPVGDVTLTIGDSVPVLSHSLPQYMNIDFGRGKKQTVGISNQGYYGMRVDTSKEYAASFHIRGEYEGIVTGSFVNTITGKSLGDTKTKVKSRDDTWTLVKFPIFSPDASPGNPNNTFHFTFDDSLQLKGRSLQVNLLSVFEETYKGRPNGLRIDMAEAFTDLGTT